MNKKILKTCPYAKNCGGCQYQGIPYERQLLIKQDRVNNLLSKYTKVNKIIPMDDPYFYRHKVQAAFGLNHRKEIISGTYQPSTHRIVAIDKCQIENQKADQILMTIRELMKSFKLRPFDDVSMQGFLRHVVIRVGYHSKQIMVIMVTGSYMFPSKKDFVRVLVEKHPEITTVIHNINNKRTSMVLGAKSDVLYGRGKIEDQLLDHTFRISPTSFYQINPKQTEVLYKIALDYAGLTKKETVLDAYCGTGTIGIIASKDSKYVIGVELNKEAVSDANENAKLNNIDNIRFVNADAADHMLKMSADNKDIDVVFVDPPRNGCADKFLAALLEVKPTKIVYVSCNPVTLERDISILNKSYKIEEIQPVDMFPYTEHVETVVLLSYKHITENVGFVRTKEANR